MATRENGVSLLDLAVDLLTYTVLSNHCHLILRSRPDLVCSWTDWEVANRWWRLCPQRKDDSNVAAEPTDEEINMLTSDAAKMKELRQRLSDISLWVTSCLAWLSMIG